MSLPNEIYVSGETLLLRGFNGKYIKTTVDRETVFVKERSVLNIGVSFLYVAQIDIRPTAISKIDGRWQLYSNDGYMQIFHSFPEKNTPSPVGDWGPILVTENQTISTWWRDNGTYIIASLCFGGAVLYKFIF